MCLTGDGTGIIGCLTKVLYLLTHNSLFTYLFIYFGGSEVSF